MLVKSNSEYDSFLFWRQPIPAPDLSELEGLSLTDRKPAKSTKVKDKKANKKAKQRKQEVEKTVELAEYSSFNYWRAPIANIDNLLADLLL
ncbi:protein AF1q [Aplochiton taeniatus]